MKNFYEKHLISAVSQQFLSDPDGAFINTPYKGGKKKFISDGIGISPVNF